jgi:hypothetical protein
MKLRAKRPFFGMLLPAYWMKQRKEQFHHKTKHFKVGLENSLEKLATGKNSQLLLYGVFNHPQPLMN